MRLIWFGISKKSNKDRKIGSAASKKSIESNESDDSDSFFERISESWMHSCKLALILFPRTYITVLIMAVWRFYFNKTFHWINLQLKFVIWMWLSRIRIRIEPILDHKAYGGSVLCDVRLVIWTRTAWIVQEQKKKKKKKKTHTRARRNKNQIIELSGFVENVNAHLHLPSNGSKTEQCRN